MIDMSVLGGAAATEASPAARGNGPAAKGGDAGNGGFSDVLSKAGNSPQNSTGGEPAGTPAADDAQTEVEEGAAGSIALNLRARSKPMIALSDASLKQQAATQPETVAIVTGKSGKDQVKSRVDTASVKFDVKEDAGEVAEDAHVAKDGKSAKTLENKTGTDEGTPSDATSVSDALGLLNKDATDTVIPAAFLAAAQVAKDNMAGKEKDAGRGTGIAPAADALAAISASDVQMPAVDDAVNLDGKTFRLSRADGRGESMEMHIGADQEASAAKAKSDIENVTVLDSRRYIGLAQNSASVTAAILGDREWTGAMQPSSALSNAAEWTSTGKVVNTLKIQMTPIDLGLVTATMRLSGDALNVDLKVETAAAYRQLKEDHGKIIEVLRSQGYAIDNVTISMAPVEKPDAGNQANAQEQSSQQQSLQQGQGGEARERHAQTAQRGNGGLNGAGQTNVEDVASGAADSGASGSVYL
ncbi:chemotaxis protein MotD [Rhizobium mongolense subsp. loessense]|uniref:Chemotaxis protein MotD n=1 Tax=Rhizobium mongolense subsp. loessense TaxID=158890 RepID=A0A1G4PP12_9HYPH|nr:flagellar hook-length control protein FliK [Rhizobium mongolense]SCW34020.1 chemotaxis protein MotD [Rhizobium mongolense subsp. loessense]